MSPNHIFRQSFGLFWSWSTLDYWRFQQVEECFQDCSHPETSQPQKTRHCRSKCFRNLSWSYPITTPKLNHVVFLCKLMPAKQNYDVGHCEILAVILVLEEWRHWLKGAAHPFAFLTDHKNLMYLHTSEVCAFLSQIPVQHVLQPWFKEHQSRLFVTSPSHQRHPKQPWNHAALILLGKCDGMLTENWQMHWHTLFLCHALWAHVGSTLVERETYHLGSYKACAFAYTSTLTVSHCSRTFHWSPWILG